MSEKTNVFSVRLTPKERAELDRLARSTGRTRGNVLKHLIRLAADPAVRKTLGAERVKTYDTQAN